MQSEKCSVSMFDEHEIFDRRIQIASLQNELLSLGFVSDNASGRKGNWAQMLLIGSNQRLLQKFLKRRIFPIC